MRFATVAACLAAAGAAAPAQEILGLNRGHWPITGFACHELGLACRISGRFEEEFMPWLTSRAWDLVMIEQPFEFTPAQKRVLLPALEEHLARGGRLLLVYTELDSWPELQDLVGVRTTFDVGSITNRRIWSVDPVHPTWTLGPDPLIACGFDPFCEVFYDDSGDYLDPDPGGYILAVWDDPESSPAITLTRSGQVLTAGFEYDAFFANGIIRTARAQIGWLLTCHADIDGDGELTFFDFLAFQNLFAAGDLRADFAFDGRLDFLDFLEFQDQFAIGCP